MKQSITVQLPDELHHELEALSQAEQTPLNDIVRESLRRYVAIRNFRRLRDKILPFAEAQGLLTDEDVFRELA